MLSPLPIAILLGLACFFTSTELPETVKQPLLYVYQFGIWPGLLFVGAYFVSDMSELKSSRRVFLVCTAKLLVFPAVIGLLLRVLPIDPVVRGVLLIAAACPSAAGTYIFAQRYGGDEGYASMIFAMTTFCSAATIPLVMFLA